MAYSQQQRESNLLYFLNAFFDPAVKATRAFTKLDEATQGYVTMSLLEGFLMPTGRLQILLVTAQVCAERFHRAGACHADLNVDNVLVNANGTCWLIDFDRGVLRRPARSWQQANIARLRRSLRKRIGARADDADTMAGWNDMLASYRDAMREPA